MRGMKRTWARLRGGSMKLDTDGKGKTGHPANKGSPAGTLIQTL